MRIASANWTLGKKLMKVIHTQEQALVFEKFMNEDAYQIGTKIKQGVEKLGHDVVDSISLGDEQLFYHAIQSIRPTGRWSAPAARSTAPPTDGAGRTTPAPCAGMARSVRRSAPRPATRAPVCKGRRLSHVPGGSP